MKKMGKSPKFDTLNGKLIIEKEKSKYRDLNHVK